MSIVGSVEGVTRAANEHGGEGIEIMIGAVDAELGGVGGGMIVPGCVLFFLLTWPFANEYSLGDIGDRLFLTIGK